jgi:mRNA-degrading endonuclease RelE of RelBE toxin-antitoxin system
MIEIYLLPKALKRLDKLSAAERENIERVLRILSREFGNPHTHSGLGIRKLAPETFECRANIRMRIAFTKEPEGLAVHGFRDHNEIIAWLKGR